METKVLNNFKISFYTFEEFDKNIACRTFNHNLPIHLDENQLYAGKVSNISEVLVKQIVDSYFEEYIEQRVYKEYKTNSILFSAKESFESLSKLECCTVEKIK